MEITFQAKVATVESTDCIQGYCTNPTEKIASYTEYTLPKVAEEVNKKIECIMEVLKNINLTTDMCFMESSQQMQPKKKSSKLMSIIRDVQTTTSQTGNSHCIHIMQIGSTCVSYKLLN